MRRSVAVAAVLFAIAFVLVGGPSLLTSPSTNEVAPADEPDPEIVTPEGAEGGFWPYLNARESFERRSPINLLVRGDTEPVVRLMQEASDGDWEETDEESEEADSFTHSLQPGDEANRSAENASFEPLATETPWSRTTGATRYAYLVDGDGSGEWVTETLQLHDGTYYGQRYHVRIYEAPDPDDRWLVMQAHTEHFDWFTLRHRVDGSEAAQSKVEADFASSPTIGVREDVTRMNLQNGGPSDSNGWATVVDLAAMALAGVGLVAGRDAVDRSLTETDRRRLAAARDRVETRHLILAGTILALVLGTRVAGIALERSVDAFSMHAIAAVLYPVVGIGLPVATYLIARGLERRMDAAVAASVSFATAIWLDYGLLGVGTLPIDVVVQRMLVVVALGAIAAGAARRATRESSVNELLVAGVAAWVLVLAGTLFGYL